MSRRLRSIVAVLFSAVALGTTACASVAGPSHADCSGTQTSETCPGE